jgi:hypothetical protein
MPREELDLDDALTRDVLNAYIAKLNAWCVESGDEPAYKPEDFLPYSSIVYRNDDMGMACFYMGVGDEGGNARIMACYEVGPVPNPTHPAGEEWQYDSLTSVFQEFDGGGSIVYPPEDWTIMNRCPVCHK